MTLAVANDAASLPIAYQPYLPEVWASDRTRRRQAGVPEELGFLTKPELAMRQITAAVKQGVPVGVVLADAAYGNDSKFRNGVEALEFKYALGSFGLAAAALACSVAVAAAAGPVAEPVGPEVLSNLIPKIQNGSANGSALAKASGGGLSTEIQGNVATGWNFFNATDCEWYTNGTDNITYVFPKQGGYWFVENNIYATDTFNTACTNGNLVAVNVINSSTGAFNAIFTYPHP